MNVSDSIADNGAARKDNLEPWDETGWIAEEFPIWFVIKKQTEVPDSVFEAFGFTLPKSIPKEYQAGSSITDFVGSGRILSLKKEWHIIWALRERFPRRK